MGSAHAVDVMIVYACRWEVYLFPAARRGRESSKSPQLNVSGSSPCLSSIQCWVSLSAQCASAPGTPQLHEVCTSTALQSREWPRVRARIRSWSVSGASARIAGALCAPHNLSGEVLTPLGAGRAGLLHTFFVRNTLLIVLQ